MSGTPENGAKNGIVDVLSRLKYLSQLDPIRVEKGSLPLTKNGLPEARGESDVVGREATTKQPPRVFISYAKEDTRAAKRTV